MWSDLRQDLRQLSLLVTGRCDWRSQCRMVLAYESYKVTALQRLRYASRTWPGERARCSAA